MRDRELLELAAKAVGNIVYVENIGFIVEDEYGNRGPWWNPIEVDGDCARMESKLDISITWHNQFVHVVSINHEIGTKEFFNKHNGDKDKARRYASTRLAAEIGRNMP